MIKPSRFFRISVDGQDIVTLTIAEAFPEDEGVYKCQVSNPAGTAVTTASLKVLLGEYKICLLPFTDIVLFTF